ncbi:MAG: hypothetical protein OJF49_002411 [Ktedonobacterales bacterium]|nr:MAG: hypothetical protein OJF49_002411 [Ktedonobacterales bacterium]
MSKSVPQHLRHSCARPHKSPIVSSPTSVPAHAIIPGLLLMLLLATAAC